MRILTLVLAIFLSAEGTYAEQLQRFHISSQSQIEDLTGGHGVTGGAIPRSINRLTLDMIKDFEGWSSKAYNDPSGYCTIGYGHLIALKTCEIIELGEFKNPITTARGLEILELDTRSARNSVEKLVKTDLEDHQFGAVVSFVFNVGRDNFEKSTLRSLLNENDFNASAKQFSRWIKSKGVILPGLVTRRTCEETHFRGGLDLPFSRSNCNSLGAAPELGPLLDVQVGENVPQ